MRKLKFLLIALFVLSLFTVCSISSSAEAVPETTTVIGLQQPHGETTVYEDFALSNVIKLAEPGAVITLYSDVAIDKEISIEKDLYIYLNDYTLKTDNRLIPKGTAEVEISGGTVEITKTELGFMSESYSKDAYLMLCELNLIKKDPSINKGLVDVRAGYVLLDTIDVVEGAWLSKSTDFIVAGYRTKEQSSLIQIDVFDSDINLSGIGFLNATSAAGETSGYNLLVQLYSSYIGTDKHFVKLAPSVGAMLYSYCEVDLNMESWIDSQQIAKVGDNMFDEHVYIDLHERSYFSGTPGVSLNQIECQTGYLVYDPRDLTFTAGYIEDCGAKLIGYSSEKPCYFMGAEFSKELVTLAQSLGYSIVFLQDMTMPNGTGTANNQQYNICGGNLKVELSGFKLTIPQYSRFTSDDTTNYLFSNGTIEHAYAVYYSYSGLDTYTTFAADNITFIATGTTGPFDHRIGNLNLKDCSFEFTKTLYSANQVFSLGNVNNAFRVFVNLDNCVFKNLEPKRSIFKLFHGRPVEATITNCTFDLGSEAYLINATNDKNTGNADNFLFSSCVIKKNGGELFNCEYSSLSTTIDDILVMGDPSLGMGSGTLIKIPGQTKVYLESGDYRITVPRIQLNTNLTLYNNFNINFWVPKVDYLVSIQIGDTIYTPDQLSVVGEYFKHVIRAVTPINSGNTIPVEIKYLAANEEVQILKFEYSIIKYFEQVLTSDSCALEAKALIVSIMNYIESVCLYANTEVPQELVELKTTEAFKLIEASSAYDPVTVIPESSIESGALNTALDSVRMRLATDLRFLFTIKEGYTGTLVFEVGGQTYTCDIVEGKYNGSSDIALTVRAKDLYNTTIKISTPAEVLGYYDMTYYFNHIQGESEVLDNLILAMYNYSKEAFEYSEFLIKEDN